MLGGCGTHSISNSGYHEDGSYGRNAFYQGEISINPATSDQDQVQHSKAAGHARLADMILAAASAIPLAN
ncbi:MAG TPA: hypothetical protein VJV39_06655 [Dongiaceae bacterium]|nr:hypothetical protein [Dongiaceae bacterium]